MAKKASAGERPAREGPAPAVPAAVSASPAAGGRQIQRDAAWVAARLAALGEAAAAEAKLAGSPGGAPGIVLAGIKSRGAILADRLAELLEKHLGRRPDVAHLDVTLYRDDLARSGGVKPYRGTELLCPLDGRTVILVDDVFHTGRTIRAALDLLMDYGRPRAVRLYVLVDRGGHELPLRPDQAGETLAVRPGERVVVRLKELDGADAVVLAPEK